MSNDDILETDGGVHNVRVFGNRGFNAGQGGYSSQPVFGGPIYFYRNILYNAPSGSAFKFAAKPAGIFVFHNTIIAEQRMGDPYSNTHYRNNLFLGRDNPNVAVMTWANATDVYSSDYNGFRPTHGAASNYRWLAPPPGGNAYTPTPASWKTFKTLSEFREATGQERHGVEIDFGYFRESDPTFGR